MRQTVLSSVPCAVIGQRIWSRLNSLIRVQHSRPLGLGHHWVSHIRVLDESSCLARWLESWVGDVLGACLLESGAVITMQQGAIVLVFSLSWSSAPGRASGMIGIRRPRQRLLLRAPCVHCGVPCCVPFLPWRPLLSYHHRCSCQPFLTPLPVPLRLQQCHCCSRLCHKPLPCGTHSHVCPCISFAAFLLTATAARQPTHPKSTLAHPCRHTVGRLSRSLTRCISVENLRLLAGWIFMGPSTNLMSVPLLPLLSLRLRYLTRGPCIRTGEPEQFGWTPVLHCLQSHSLPACKHRQLMLVSCLWAFYFAQYITAAGSWLLVTARFRMLLGSRLLASGRCSFGV